MISEQIHTISASRNIDGIRLISVNDTVASAEITEGGVGYDFFTFKVVARANFLDIKFHLYENGTYLEKREEVLGEIDGDSKFLDS